MKHAPRDEVEQERWLDVLAKLAARACAAHHLARGVRPAAGDLARRQLGELGPGVGGEGRAGELASQRLAQEVGDAPRDGEEIAAQRAGIDCRAAEVVKYALECCGDEGTARRPSPVDAGLVDLGRARDAIDAEAGEAMLRELGERLCEHRVLDRRAPRPSRVAPTTRFGSFLLHGQGRSHLRPDGSTA